MVLKAQNGSNNFQIILDSSTITYDPLVSRICSISWHTSFIRNLQHKYVP